MEEISRLGWWWLWCLLYSSRNFQKTFCWLNYLPLRWLMEKIYTRRQHIKLWLHWSSIRKWVDHILQPSCIRCYYRMSAIFWKTLAIYLMQKPTILPTILQRLPLRQQQASRTILNSSRLCCLWFWLQRWNLEVGLIRCWLLQPSYHELKVEWIQWSWTS